MRRKFLKVPIAVTLIVLSSAALVGCGKKEINVTDGLAVEFNGVDGYGTARVADEFFWEEEALEAAGLEDGEETENSLRGVYLIETAVEYEVSPDEGLSNGDEVTVTVKLDNESVGDYKIRFAGKEKKFTVEGLKEVEEIDLFEGVELEYQGFAPYVKASVNSQKANKDVYVDYTIDKSDNLDTGDTIVMTAEYDEEDLLQKGYMAEGNTKEFVVPECDRYITKIADVPDEMVGKINKQFEDTYRAYVASKWVEPESLQGIEPIGSYLLTPKEGGSGNAYYGVYRINVDVQDGPSVIYSYIRYKDIIILKDGTCSLNLSDYDTPSGGMFSEETFTAGGRYYRGYKDLDSLFNYCVTRNLEKYEYESTVAAE